MIATTTLCLALNIYFEARNQPIEGQMAVAQVTLYRSKVSQKGVCEVVAAPAQFSWVGDKMPRKVTKSGKYTLDFTKKDLPRGKSWQKSLEIARKALHNSAKLPQITHFHATYVSPKWAEKIAFVRKIGDHLFYFEEKWA